MLNRTRQRQKDGGMADNRACVSQMYIYLTIDSEDQLGPLGKLLEAPRVWMSSEKVGDDVESGHCRAAGAVADRGTLPEWVSAKAEVPLVRGKIERLPGRTRGNTDLLRFHPI